MDKLNIVPGLMVHVGGGRMAGARGPRVGTVDHLEGDNFIKLRKKDSADGRHHWIPVELVDSVDDEAIYLNMSEEEFHARTLEEPQQRNVG